MTEPTDPETLRKQRIADFAEQHRARGEQQGRAAMEPELQRLQTKVDVLQTLLAEERQARIAAPAPLAQPISPAAAPTGQSHGRVLTIGGAWAVTLGCLLPFVSVPLLGGVSVLRMDYGWVVFAASVLAALALTHKPTRTLANAWVILCILQFGYMFYVLFGDSGEGKAIRIGPDIGALLIAGGVIAMVVGASYLPKQSVSRKRIYALLGTLAVLLVVGRLLNNPKPQLQIAKLECAGSHDGTMTASGTVRNTGTRTLQGVRLDVRFDDKDGKVLVQTRAIVDPSRLAPGQSGTYIVSVALSHLLVKQCVVPSAIDGEQQAIPLKVM